MSESSNSSKIPKLNDSEKSKLPINNKDTLFQYWKLTFNSGIYSPENTSLYALLAGIMLGFGFATVLFSESYKTLGLYIISLGFFHFSEYLVTAIFNPDRVKLGSFMYDPVPGYHYAIGFSFLEWFLTRWILPQWVWNYFAIIQLLGNLI
jgi:protein-S-isoprenylcysteine O-methyltransferase